MKNVLKENAATVNAAERIKAPAFTFQRLMQDIAKTPQFHVDTYSREFSIPTTIVNEVLEGDYSALNAEHRQALKRSHFKLRGDLY